MLSAIPQILEEKISHTGHINVAEFMEICLYEPIHGYYMSRDPFGKEGDFTTAPEISPLFGEIIAAWLIDTWEKMDRPEPFNLVEVGPGRGTLMSDILRIAKKVSPAFYNCAHICLVEKSPYLKTIQQKTLEAYPMTWYEEVTQINNNAPFILIGNEILDAMPVRQFEKGSEGYSEKLIHIKEGQFKFYNSVLNEEISGVSAPLIEKPEAMEQFLGALKNHINQGVCLFIDYGDDVEEPFQGATLQALYKHQKIDLFEQIGESDLTTHVNFSHVRRTLGEESTTSTVPMGPWLINLGLAVRAAGLRAHLDEAGRKELEDQVYRLVHNEEMGQLFKAIAWQKEYDIPLAGF